MVEGWYDSMYNEAEFVPYDGNVFAPDDTIEVMTIKVDGRTHYRITRNRDGGEARYVMMRRLSADGPILHVSRIDGRRNDRTV